MKLIYIANLRIPTEKAYGIQIAKMCEAFALNGINVTLVFPTRKSPIREDLFSYYGINESFRIARLLLPDFYLPGRLDRIAFVAKNFICALALFIYAALHKNDVIYSRDEMPIYFLSFFGRKIIYEAHRFSARRLFFYRRFLKKGIKIVAISEGIKDKFLRMGFKDINLLVAHDAVDLSKFDILLSKEGARLKTNLPLNKKIVMYAGHLFPWKGVDTLALAAKRMPNVDFIFIGGTDSDLRVFRSKFSFVSNIKILGFRPHGEIPAYLKLADVLVLPNSAKEKISSFTSPLKLFEYMAAKRPIVASDLPSIREVLNEDNSILVRADDPEALAGGIKKALEDVALSDRISQTAFEKVKNFTWQKRARLILEFIK